MLFNSIKHLDRVAKTVALFAVALLLSSCASQTKYEPRIQKQALSSSSQNTDQKCRSPYLVKKGDTLSGIAHRCHLDMKQIAKVNDLLPPYIIYIKQKLWLPYAPATVAFIEKTTKQSAAKTESKPEPKTTSSKADSTKKTAAKQSKPVTKTETKKPKPSTSPQKGAPAKPIQTAKAIERAVHNKTFSSKPTKWQWPTHKGLDYRFRRDKAGLSVLEVYGVPGQSIAAVAPGKVVYSGNGIANYGWMVVLKHDGDYMSIYAHNSALLVKEGDWVKAGEEIATLGATGDTSKPKLYLEARYQGRKIDIKKKLKR